MTLIFWNALYTGDQRHRRGVLPRSSTGLNVHVGYTGLLNFGQAGFAAVGAYAFAIPIVDVRLAVVLGAAARVRRLDRCSPSCSASRRCACAPTTSRSSRSPPPRSSGYFLNSTRFTWLTGGTDGRKGWTGVLPGPQPVGQRRPLPPRRPVDRRLPAVHDDPRLVARRAHLAARLGADAQPVGSRARRASARTRTPPARSARTSLAFKMQSLILGGVIGSIGGLMARRPDAVGADRAVRHDADVLRLHDHRPRRARPGEGSDRRHDHLLLRDPVRRQRARARRRGTTSSPTGSSTGTTSARSSSSSPGSILAAARRLPAAGHLRRPPRAGVRCPLSS